MSSERRRFIKQMLAIPFMLTNPACVAKPISVTALKAQGYQLDPLGIWHASGFRVRVVANSGHALPNGFVWPGAPDGGAVFAQPDGGWIYVCNSELGRDRGGVAALRFNRDAKFVDAYAILTNSNMNCAGGATPWGSWLSCEEHQRGRVWQCDPLGQSKAQVCRGLGVFTHESVAVDPQQKILYLTEDQKDGAFYRYLPATVADGAYDLQQGELQACVWDSKTQQVEWRRVTDPDAKHKPTRYQLKVSRFAGGEGICWFDGSVYFNTKWDSRIWQYQTLSLQLRVYYQTREGDMLRDADAMTTTPDGSLWAAEDGDDMQVVAMDKKGRQKVLLQIQGQPLSEITGLAFSPDYRRLYFSSQRGTSARFNSPKAGITYEMEGDFLSWLQQ